MWLLCALRSVVSVIDVVFLFKIKTYKMNNLKSGSLPKCGTAASNLQGIFSCVAIMSSMLK